MVSVVFPVRNEAKTIASLVRLVRQHPVVSEVIVVDDGSIDQTISEAAEAGARVITSSLMGKGASMEDGLKATASPYILYLDGDLADLPADLIDKMTAPLLAREADFVKGCFDRAGGRVTELTAKPLLRIFFPEIAHFSQPLGGIVAGRVDFLRKLSFEDDYGVDIALLLDAHIAGGKIVEVNVGMISHDSQPLHNLSNMANQVLRVILDRAHRHSRNQGDFIQEVLEYQRHLDLEVESIRKRVRLQKEVVLIDKDEVLLQEPFIVSLARLTGRDSVLAPLMVQSGDEVTRLQAIAAAFAGISRQTFADLAKSTPLRPGAAEAVIALRKMGATVVVISNAYHISTEIICKRVFADFSLANMLFFKKGVNSGHVQLNPFYFHDRGCVLHEYCPANIVTNLDAITEHPYLHCFYVSGASGSECLRLKSLQNIMLCPSGSDIGLSSGSVIRDLSELVQAWNKRAQC